MDYDSFASLYDLTCPGVEGDLEFFLQKAKNAASVLEVGCGTGRIYLPLQKAGVNIKGIDTSKGMLNLLKKKARKIGVFSDVELESVIDYSHGAQFDLILLPYRTFMHLHTRDEQIKALQNLKRLLLPEGEVVIDLFNPDIDRIKKGSAFFLLEKIQNGYVWLWEEFDQEKQIVHNLFRLEEVNQKGRVIKTTIKEFNARWTFKEEFDELVNEVGFTTKVVLADYFGTLFTGKEDKMIWILGV